MTIKISVDSGKHSTKYGYLGLNNSSIYKYFPTNIKMVDEFNEWTKENSIEFNSKKFILDKNTNDLDFDNSKLKEKHELCIYYAICKVIKAKKLSTDIRHDVSLAINVPLKDYIYAQIRNSYVMFYAKKNVDITINGIDYKFHIKSVTPYYEGIGPLYKPQMKFTSTKVYNVDIGGKNDTHLATINKKPIGTTVYVGNNGILNLYNEVAKRMTMIRNTTYTAKDVEDILKGLSNKVSEFDEVFNDECKIFLNNIFSTIISKNINLDTVNICFTGGGSVFLKEQAEKIYNIKIYISNEPYFDNCSVGLMYLMNDNETK